MRDPVSDWLGAIASFFIVFSVVVVVGGVSFRVMDAIVAPDAPITPDTVYVEVPEPIRAEAFSMVCYFTNEEEGS